MPQNQIGCQRDEKYRKRFLTFHHFTEHDNNGRVPLYLTWLYICMFFNVGLAGIFGLWSLGVTSVLALALLGLTRNNSTPTADKTKDDLEDYYPE